MSFTADDLTKQFHEAQGKYTYFLLAAAGSGIALAVQRTGGAALRWSMIPLGLAVICWACSFFSGCRNRQFHHSVIYANWGLLRILSGTHPDVPNHPAMIVAAAEGAKSALDANSRTAGKWANRQFWFLVAGAVLFVAWHVIEMALRT